MTINELHNILRLRELPLHTQSTKPQQRKEFGLQEIVVKEPHATIKISSIQPDTYYVQQTSIDQSHHIKEMFKHLMHHNQISQLRKSNQYIKQSIKNFIKTPIQQRAYNYADITNIATHKQSRFDLIQSLFEYHQRHVIYPTYNNKNITINQFDDIMVANNFNIYLAKSKAPASEYGYYDIQANNDLINIEISALMPNKFIIAYNNHGTNDVNTMGKRSEYDFSGEPASDFINVDIKQAIHNFAHTAIPQRDYKHAMIDDKHRAFEASADLVTSLIMSQRQAPSMA